MDEIEIIEKLIITKEEIQAFYEDAAVQRGDWSDKSRRIVEFFGMDPTAGL